MTYPTPGQSGGHPGGHPGGGEHPGTGVPYPGGSYGPPQTGAQPRPGTGAYPTPGPPPGGPSTTGSTSRPVTPTRVIGGRYVVLGELGRGGMGIVWRAEDRVIGRQGAVKELHLADGLSPEDRHNFRERLPRRARPAGRVSDPRLVPGYHVRPRKR